MKTQLSSLELKAIITELQFLLNSKIDQIYQPEKKEFLFRIHVPGKGKHFLKIILGKFIYLTQQKPLMPPASGFCLLLRKHLNNTLIKSISQKNSERIIQIKLQKEKKYLLIIELFSRGNLILCDSELNIISAAERQTWATREIKPKTKYLYPPPSCHWLSLSSSQLKELIKKTKKNKLVTFLATEIGLGGSYAEELCLKTKLNKNIPPQKLKEKEIKSILNIINQFKKTQPKGIIYQEKDITPFELEIYQKTPKKELPTYNQALDLILSQEIKEQKKQTIYKEKLEKLNIVIKKQQNRINELEKSIKENTQKAELIYNNYTLIKKILESILKAQKQHGWSETKKRLKGHKLIKDLNLKEKKIILEIN